MANQHRSEDRREGAEEAQERRSFLPLDPGSPTPEDAGGSVGEEDQPRARAGQTSQKAGSRSVTQKEAGSKYADRAAPHARKAAGGSGREPR